MRVAVANLVAIFAIDGGGAAIFGGGRRAQYAGLYSGALFTRVAARNDNPCAGSTAVATYTAPTDTDKPIITDCNTLLAAKDTLRGAATLNWSKDLAMASWTGIALTTDATPSERQVRRIDLTSQSLAGAIPTQLGSLPALTHRY